MKPFLEADYVRSCVRYDDGRLYWLSRPLEHFPTNNLWASWNQRFPGKEAGTVKRYTKNKRLIECCFVYLQYFSVPRDSLVWLIHRGEWVFLFDHVNQDSLDDRIENLRPRLKGL